MRRLSWMALAVALLLAACGGGDDDGSTNTLQSTEPSDMVGAAGGTVSSDRGDLHLEIPAGALSEDTQIEVVEIPAADLGGDVSALSGPVYDLLPDGLTFSSPVTLTRTFDAAALGLNAGEVPFLIIIHEQPEAWDLLDSATRRTGNTVEVSAEITHFTGSAVIDVQVLQPFGDEVRLVMYPDAFEAEKGLGELVFLTTEVPSVVNRAITDITVSWRLGEILTGTPGDAGGLVLCDGVGEDTYSARLEVKINDFKAINEFPSGLFAFFSGSQGDDASLRVDGDATCTGPGGEASTETTDTGLGGVDSFAGDLTFDAIEGDLTYTDSFTLEYMREPSDDEDGVALYLAELQALADDLRSGKLSDDTVVLSQLRPGGEDQETYGVAANRTDGSQLVITAGFAPTHLELYILEVEQCSGYPFECNNHFVNGWNFGLAAQQEQEELDAAIELALAFIEEREAEREGDPSDFLWSFDVNGEFSAVDGGGETAPPDVDSEITDVDSGLFEGERWIKLELGQPIPGSDDQFIKQYNVFIRSDQDDLFGASWSVVQGQDPFASSFCLQDRPNCPLNGIVPVLGLPGETGDDITFFFAIDAFGDATGLEFSANVQTGLTDAPEDLVTEDFDNGIQLPWIELEKDPC